MKGLTFKQYRNIDLLIFSVMLGLSEVVATIASNKWFDKQPVAISATLLFICIVMMRWNGFAAIHACLGGLVFCITSIAVGYADRDFIVQQLVTYIVGNCFALLAMLWFKVFEKEDIRKDIFKLILFVGSAYVLLEVGRWIVSLFFGGGLSNLIGFFVADIISLLFAGVIMVFLRGVDGMIEDQKAYLFRVQREEKEKQEDNYQGGYGSEE